MSTKLSKMKRPSARSSYFYFVFSFLKIFIYFKKYSPFVCFQLCTIHGRRTCTGSTLHKTCNKMYKLEWNKDVNIYFKVKLSLSTVSNNETPWRLKNSLFNTLKWIPFYAESYVNRRMTISRNVLMTYSSETLIPIMDQLVSDGHKFIILITVKSNPPKIKSYYSLTFECFPKVYCTQ